MTAHIAPEDLSAYVDDEISPPRRAEIDAHLVGCGACAAMLDELRWTVRYTSAMPLAELPNATALGVGPRSGEGRRPARPLWWAGAAAAVAAIALVSLTLPRLRTSIGESEGAFEVAMMEEEMGASATPGGPSLAEVVGAAPLQDGPEVATDAAAGATRTFARRPTPDSLKAGYPRPLSTARQGDMERQGAVPPPEYGGAMDVPTVTGRRPSADGEESAGAAPGFVAERNAAAGVLAVGTPREGTTGAEEAAVALAAPGSQPATPLARSLGEPSRDAGAETAAVDSRMQVPGVGVALAIAVAAVLLVFSAALFVRGWTR